LKKLVHQLKVTVKSSTSKGSHSFVDFIYCCWMSISHVSQNADIAICQYHISPAPFHASAA